MSQVWRIESILFLLFAMTACGNDSRFGGELAQRQDRSNEDGPDDPSLDQTQADAGGSDTSDAGGTDAVDSGDAADADGGSDVGTDAGTDGTPVPVPETLSLFWHWPCATKVSAPAPKDPDAMVITGGGDFMLEANDLQLEIGGEVCAPADGPRDVLFVVDVSDSMRDFLNLGNDPVKNGSCGRNDAVTKVLDSLGDEARVALVTFDGNPQTVSNGYLTVAAFKTRYANVATLCQKGNSTNFKKAFTASLGVLAKARADSAKELYFISDGEPNSSDVDGHLEAATIKKTATIATVMLKGDEVYMRDVLASRDAADQPLHAKVPKAADLAAALAKLADVELKAASIRYGALGDEANWQDVALGVPADRTFGLQPWTLTTAAWPKGFGFVATTVDSKGVKTESSGKLLWKP